MKKMHPLLLRWKLPYVALIGIIFALVAVFGRDEPKAKSPNITPPKSNYAETISGIGVIEPQSELISIGVELAGVVRNVEVKVGDNVKKNDVLFALDQRDIDAQIITLERSLQAANVQYQDSTEQFAIVSGMQDKRAVAKDDYNRRKFGKELAAIRIEEIKAQLNQAKITKERLIVKAPIEGQILEINVRPGEFASAGALNQPLLRMGDVSTLHVRVEIDEENTSHISAKNQAQGLRRGDPTNAIPLSFVRFEPYVKPKQNLAVVGQRVDTRVLQAIYALPKNTQRIFVGQQMDVFINSNKEGAK